MISYLKGTIKFQGVDFLVILVGNIGYKVFIKASMLNKKNTNKEIELYTHQRVKEDTLDLYGFTKLENLEFFELLLSVSGIGPKTALNATAIADTAELKRAIAGGDPSLLEKVSGIGKKTAERIVLELREKIKKYTSISSDTSINGTIGSSDEIDALISLGYSVSQAREALAKVSSTTKDSGSRVKEALKNINIKNG